jgi:hypothetical protein
VGADEVPAAAELSFLIKAIAVFHLQ